MGPSLPKTSMSQGPELLPFLSLYRIRLENPFGVSEVELRKQGNTKNWWFYEMKRYIQQKYKVEYIF